MRKACFILPNWEINLKHHEPDIQFSDIHLNRAKVEQMLHYVEQMLHYAVSDLGFTVSLFNFLFEVGSKVKNTIQHT